jgi:hypothetical protein
VFPSPTGYHVHLLCFLLCYIVVYSIFLQNDRQLSWNLELQPVLPVRWLGSWSHRNFHMVFSHEFAGDYVEMLAYLFPHYYSQTCWRMVSEIAGVINFSVKMWLHKSQHVIKVCGPYYNIICSLFFIGHVYYWNVTIWHACSWEQTLKGHVLCSFLGIFHFLILVGFTFSLKWRGGEFMGFFWLTVHSSPLDGLMVYYNGIFFIFVYRFKLI